MLRVLVVSECLTDGVFESDQISSDVLQTTEEITSACQIGQTAEAAGHKAQTAVLPDVRQNQMSRHSLRPGNGRRKFLRSQMMIYERLSGRRTHTYLAQGIP